MALLKVAGRGVQPDTERVRASLCGGRTTTLPGGVHVLVELVDLCDAVGMHLLQRAGRGHTLVEGLRVAGIDLLPDRPGVNRPPADVRFGVLRFRTAAEQTDQAAGEGAYAGADRSAEDRNDRPHGGTNPCTSRGVLQFLADGVGIIPHDVPLLPRLLGSW